VEAEGAGVKLHCPRTGLPLAETAGDAVATPGGESTYPVRHGVPVIRDSDARDRGLFGENIDRLAELLARPDWRTALLDWTGGQVEGIPLHRALANENTAAWKTLLPPAARGRLLYFSARLGCEPLALGRWCDEVVACDANLGHAVFVAGRARHLGLDNVQAVCAGDTTPLPFPAGHFDAVVVNGLDWFRPMRRADQVAFLAGIRRLLRDGRHLWLGAENRWGFTQWRGWTDPATGLRFPSLLPRALTNAWARLRGRKETALTYGRGGFRRLLADAGFAATRFYSALPHFGQPEDLVSLGADGAAERRAAPDLRERLHRDPRWAATFGIVAGADRAEPSWLEGLVAHVADRLDLPAPAGLPRVVVSGATAAGLILFPGRDLVVRLPLHPESLARVERNHEGLLQARALRERIGADTPEPLLRDRYGAVEFTVEQRLQGEMLDDLEPSSWPGHEDRMMELLLALQRVACDGEVDAAAQWRETVVEPFRRAVAWGRDADERRAIEEYAAAAADTDPSLVPLTLSHGDFKWNNMLITGGGRALGLFDWDRWSPRELATHDFLHFLMARRCLRRKRPWAEMLAEWVDGEGADEAERRWTERFAGQAGLETGWRGPAVMAYWARTTAVMAGTDYDLNRRWFRPNFLSLLPRMRAARARGSVSA
jgi:aminoglycoside phosphotransferase (APT) family kinase protein